MSTQDKEFLQVGRVVALSPAQAMRPPSPPQYRKMLIERYGLAQWLSPGARMVVRTVERRPLRALVTIVGIASGVGVLISGTFWWDSVQYLIDVQFQAIQRADTELALVEPMSSYVRREIERMPGVRRVEVSRVDSNRQRGSHIHGDEQRVNVILDLTSPPEQWTRLGDAYRVDARIVVFRAEQGTQVPMGALFRSGDEWATFVVNSERAEKRVVKIMRRNGVAALISDGLRAGERVVLYPSDTVRNGARLKPRAPPSV